jgi:hypothetical protein
LSRPHRPRAGGPGSGRRWFSSNRLSRPNTANRSAPQDHGWQPGELQIYFSRDLHVHDPSCSVPKVAHSAWVRDLAAGKLRCVHCGARLRLGTPSHPFMLGSVRFRFDRVNQMLMT